MVLPIASDGNFARTAGFAVALTGAGIKTTGVFDAAISSPGLLRPNITMRKFSTANAAVD